jgi:hypothetical protein
MFNPIEEMVPVEKSMLDKGDVELIVQAIYANGLGWCHLSKEFIKEIVKLNNPLINDALFANNYIFPKEVVDGFLEARNIEAINKLFANDDDDAYHRFDAEQGVLLLELDDEAITKIYMKRYGEYIFDYGWYSQVAEYLRSKGKYNEYYEMYSPAAKRASKRKR